MHCIDYRYLRSKKVEAVKAWVEEPFERNENPKIWVGTNASILPLRRVEGDSLQFGRGGVLDSEGNYVDLSAVDDRVQFSYPYEKAEFVDQKVVYCGYLIDHWGHFLIEASTRLWYFLENDTTVDKYVFFLDENEQREIRGNYKVFFQLLGIWDKLEFINRPTTYREVIIPERGYQVRTSYSPKQLRIFDVIGDNVQVDPSWETPEKIYLSRSMLEKAKPFEFGFDALDNFFEKNGYTILYPERIPLGQMIHYIRNCKVVAALQGSLTHNMLFGHDGQKIEIIERQVITDDNQVDINRMRGLHAVYVDANIPIYTIDCVGPYIMGYTDCLKRFAADMGYQPPDEKYLTKKYYKKCFVSYMKSYQDLFRYNWFFHEWYAPFTESLFEGFREGHEFFGEYLDGSRPFLWHHYLELHYFKQWVKRILKKLNLRG